MRAVQFVLDSTYFTFDNIIYKQNFGAPMGSPLSPIIADVVMQDLENEVLSLISMYSFFIDTLMTLLWRFLYLK